MPPRFAVFYLYHYIYNYNASAAVLSAGEKNGIFLQIGLDLLPDLWYSKNTSKGGYFFALIFLRADTRLLREAFQISDNREVPL